MDSTAQTTLSADQEDAADLAAVDAVLARNETPIPWEEATRELGIIRLDGPREYVTGTTEPLTLEHDEIGAPVTEAPTHILAGIDDDMDADLAALGITLSPDVERALDQAHREAMAATLLRRMQRNAKEREEIARTMELQIEQIRVHYERRLAPLEVTYARLESFVLTLAELTEWGKKKSAATPFGTFGVRTSAATVERVDEAALVAWAATEKPELVRITAALPLSQARELFTDAELSTLKRSVEWGALKKTLSPDGTLPPGVRAVPAAVRAFAEPAVIGEG
jgi:hypothetical protein